jgi:selenocysteine-specific elongation factor
MAAGVRQRDADGPVRLPIDRVFTMRGFGTVATGTLVSGEIHDEEELDLLPSGRRVKVRGIQVHGQAAGSAAAGNRVAVNLGGVEVGDLARGDTLAAAAIFEPSRRLDVAIDVLDDAKPLKHGARVRFHHGTSELLGRVAIAGPRTGRGTAVEIPAGASAYARIRLEAPAVPTRGDRFILRAYSPPVTIGGGVVLDPQPPRGAIRTEAGLARFARIDGAASDPDAALAAFIDERGPAGLSRRALTGRLGFSPRAADTAVERLRRAGRVTGVADLLVAPRVLGDLGARLLAAIEAHHAAEPLAEGLPREEARERLFGRAAPAVFERVIDDLTAAGTIVARDRLSRAGRQLSLSPEEARAQAALEAVYRDAGLSPPDVATAAAGAGIEPAVADRVVKLLLRQKTLIRLDTLLFHADTLARVKSDVRALKAGPGAPRVDVGAFKERYGISRKFAIPLLEYLDRERVTRRVGEARVVL